MNKELLEAGVEVQDIPEKYTYQQYVHLGGIINEKDYNSALSRLQIAEEENEIQNESQIKQAENMAKSAGIELSDQDDPRVKLYSILRSDTKPEKQEYHHQNMGDRRLFSEALRMLQDTMAFDKFKTACHANRPLGTRCTLCGKIEYSENCI